MAAKGQDAYRTISEAAAETGLPAHVLRFWESKFSQLRPVKRAGGRRLYRPQDISLIAGLKHLLYEEGYTIKGAQKYLKDHGVGGLMAVMAGEGDAAGPRAATGSDVGEDAPLFQAGPPSTSQTAAVEDSERIERLHSVISRLKQAGQVLQAVRRTN